MKKLVLILACVSICVISCKQKTTEQNTQIQNVESEELVVICQSCGMPMIVDDFGTNADGTPNSEYCKYCYVDGSFTAPDLTMDAMIEVCVPHMIAQGIDEETARTLLQETLPTLKRWQEQE